MHTKLIGSAMVWFCSRILLSSTKWVAKSSSSCFITKNYKGSKVSTHKSIHLPAQTWKTREYTEKPVLPCILFVHVIEDLCDWHFSTLFNKRLNFSFRKSMNIIVLKEKFQILKAQSLTSQLYKGRITSNKKKQIAKTFFCLKHCGTC